MPESAAYLLIVDDEPNIRDLLAQTFRLAGFEVSCAAGGAEALHSAAARRPDLVVLDVMLPDLGGFDVAALLRRDGEQTPVPVLFLTARDTVEDRIQGLSAGADDYVTKPFSLEEVVLRVRAILRRTGHGNGGNGGDGGGGPAGAPPPLRCADLTLRPDAHEVTRAGRPVELSPTEFRLLAYLLENTGRVVSKAQILDRVWGYDFGGDSRIVESYIHYLRRKIDSGAGPPLIHTLRGVGYVLRTPREEPTA
ncbi:response regulator transcription factor [Streptomyces aidingensis]|uniref:DNA-binding response regulator, OmpR family, contains REC and winged-helix (WHTH) domain n=1 Tax=Streptomyces aidingensis TaxID=910347 RepID=A0A1I1UYD6_9ACTN|nr:response regulator transcription factor [Streptomyces aidingensis]SFD75817.1 DNA-binding response regulator, OmpR family, contains REC and winged-helix (wHTH) domain [Streptomyces aidingensis]